MQSISEPPRIIIIGAGAAGISSALYLKSLGITPIILEASNRRGGRCLTQNLGDFKVDLGASWIHSYGDSNQIRDWVRKNKYPLVNEPQGERQYFDEIEGKFTITQLLEQHENASELIETAQRRGKDNEEANLYDLINPEYENIKKSQKDFQNRVLDMMLNKTEHYYAASLEELSAYYFDHTEYGEYGGDATPKDGYGTLMEKMSEGLDIIYNQEVIEINYSEGKVEVKTKNGEKFEANYAIITVSLGILKKNLIKFNPELPKEKQKVIDKLGFGLMNKIILRFRKNFWGSNVSCFSISSVERGKFPWFFNFSNEKNVLCCFVTDKFAKNLEKLTDQEIIDSVMEYLHKLYKNEKEIELEGYIITKWGQNPFALGSYSFFAAGSKPSDCDTLKESILKTVYFAGEACYKKNIGVCHGAYATGVEAAKSLIFENKMVTMTAEKNKSLKKNDK